jgi:hypothetical protein
MGFDGGITVQIDWTRAELAAVREAIEVTPCFEGRAEARETLRDAMRARRTEPVELDAGIACRLVSRMAPIDYTTAMAKVKLQQAVRPHIPQSGKTRIAAR